MEPYILCDGLPYLITRALNCVRNKNYNYNEKIYTIYFHAAIGELKLKSR